MKSQVPEQDSVHERPKPPACARSIRPSLWLVLALTAARLLTLQAWAGFSSMHVRAPGCGQVLWRGAGKTSPECHVPASKPTCNHSWGLSLSSSTFPFITLVAADPYGTGLSRDNRVEVISKVDAYFGLPAVASDYASRNLLPFKSLCRDGRSGSQFESP